MTSFETLASSFALRALWIGPRSTDSLLTEPDQLDFVARLSQNRMGLGPVPWRSFGFVIPAESFSCSYYAHAISMDTSVARSHTPAVV